MRGVRGVRGQVPASLLTPRASPSLVALPLTGKQLISRHRSESENPRDTAAGPFTHWQREGRGERHHNNITQHSKKNTTRHHNNITHHSTKIPQHKNQHTTPQQHNTPQHKNNTTQHRNTSTHHNITHHSKKTTQHRTAQHIKNSLPQH